MSALKRIARRAHSSCEKGSAVESVVILPLVLAIIFLIIQAGIWGHARNIAFASAREGASAAALYKSNASATDVAKGYLNSTASGIFKPSSVSSTRTANYVEVRVIGRSLSLVPLVELPQISANVRIPVERYTQ